MIQRKESPLGEQLHIDLAIWKEFIEMTCMKKSAYRYSIFFFFLQEDSLSWWLKRVKYPTILNLIPL